MPDSKKQPAHNKGSGKPLRVREVRLLIDLLTDGACALDSADIPVEAKYQALRRQMACLQLIAIAPDVVRQQIQFAVNLREAQK